MRIRPEHATVTVFVRSRQEDEPPVGALSREAFAQRYGADAADCSASRTSHARTA